MTIITSKWSIEYFYIDCDTLLGTKRHYEITLLNFKQIIEVFWENVQDQNINTIERQSKHFQTLKTYNVMADIIITYFSYIICQEYIRSYRNTMHSI